MSIDSSKKHTCPLNETSNPYSGITTKYKNGKPNLESISKEMDRIFKERMFDLKFCDTFHVDKITREWSHDAYVLQGEDIDMNYFEEQKDFIKSLDDNEKKILTSYTQYGDRLINGILRGKWNKDNLYDYIQSKVDHNSKDNNSVETFENVFENIFDVKLITKENCMKIVKEYVDKFQTLFLRVPPLKKKLRVFRGLKTSETFDPRKGGIPSPTTDFLSTTYDPHDSSLNNYTGKATNNKEVGCCLMEFVIQPGVRALWIAPISYYQNEKEIIIENGIALYNGCRRTKELMFNLDDLSNNNNNTRDVVDWRPVEVFEFEIKPYESTLAIIRRKGKTIINTGRQILRSLCHLRRTRNNKIEGGRRTRKLHQKKNGKT